MRLDLFLESLRWKSRTTRTTTSLISRLGCKYLLHIQLTNSGEKNANKEPTIKQQSDFHTMVQPRSIYVYGGT